MAEAAGLAIGGVALASLFTSCIELFEYFDQCKSFSEDFRTALMKVKLMKNRLGHWLRAMTIHQSDLLGRGPTIANGEDRGAIEESLLKIVDILDSTDGMCRRYTYHHERKSSSTYQSTTCHPDSVCASAVFQVVSQRLSYSSEPDDHNLSRLPRRKTFRNFRLRTLWIVQDKKKLDALIADFDFLLKNLEQIGDKTKEDRSTMSTPNYANTREQSDIKMLDLPTAGQEENPSEGNKDSLVGQVANERNVPGNERREARWSQSDPIMGVTLQQLVPKQTYSHDESHWYPFPGTWTGAVPNQQHHPDTRQQTQHHYQHNRAVLEGIFLAGNVLSQGSAPPTHDRGHNYDYNEAIHKGLFVAGNSDPEAVLQITRHQPGQN
ncbi:hypothetical protein AB5N19_12887 [Seiridium cardinale]|uniref:Prion-inhibition and propagation HeLo domain-containing protein n=1 Tax=Seiridium cardinale TaxID=138064 RepID=A0ABR2Y049_9PEZI